eukprot:6170286-Prymnesium_polylepis.1
MQRIWSRVVASAQATPEQVSHGITFTQFQQGVENVTFLRLIASQYRVVLDNGQFKVPADYDYAKSTNDNYGDEVVPHSFFGEHIDLRAKIDYSYHANYVRRPQRAVPDELCCPSPARM